MSIRVRIRFRRRTATPVYLNVYDITPINGYFYWLGLGIYHSDVQVHGVEYGYGWVDNQTRGIVEAEPRQCPECRRLRKSILIGMTDMGPREVRAFMDELAEEYTHRNYHLIAKNCNHFCNDVCLRLVGKPIPRWVNRLAKIGYLLCNCLLQPATTEGSVPGAVREGEKKKLPSRSVSARPASTAMSAARKTRRRRSESVLATKRV